ncbi:MAG: 30S ribosomal protein S11 [Candidatus Vogelbacteria bacterium CG10_big_fil_rev_8_21_14_0_10_45_14]|uniref:Small ribosomal subunit protein uS11 n=1 Tax=Candidatus Vogelbacteria bacterium CG10_big_fil_rev_8_21_14_0_10_45_14 TaxID=1975042 RepID=A0A2H0RL18_9BACT|nr:MAG: 30S ribosomal protein S11 [Candidatus Vogelbacteria bacterium CG10_big_fil_rev_8_21_14_0_10_45_14]
MGKKRVIEKGGSATGQGGKTRAQSKGSKRRISRGILNVQATYNNTLLTLADDTGNAVAQSSSGSLGFKGAKKGTPFAAAKVGELLAEKAMLMGVKEVSVVVRGVGSGRESSIRAFTSKGITITAIEDRTPVPHNGPRAKKARRV